MPSTGCLLKGVGLGLRRSLLEPLQAVAKGSIDFMEVAPENWINVGGRLAKQFRSYTEQYPFAFHGLSLSIGSPSPLNIELLNAIKTLMQEHGVADYSEHLSYCSDDGQLYDLLPIPFTEEAVHYVAQRIRQAQDILGCRMAIENASYYYAPSQELSEIDFINAVISEADCDLLLDVNNIYVNSINHQYNASDFLRKLPLERTRYIHIAGHFVEAEDLRVDTHGADVIDPVWQILRQAYDYLGAVPTLLERDFNIPPVPELLQELEKIKQMQAQSKTVTPLVAEKG